MVLGLLLCMTAAVLPAAMLYFPNLSEIAFSEMLPYFGAMCGIGALAWAGMYLVTRRKGLAAVAAAAWLLVLLNIGRAVPALQTVFPLAGLKIIAPAVLVLQVLWGSRDLQAHQVKMLHGALLCAMPNDRGVPIGAISLTYSLAICVDLRCYLCTGVLFY